MACVLNYSPVIVQSVAPTLTLRFTNMSLNSELKCKKNLIYLKALETVRDFSLVTAYMYDIAIFARLNGSASVLEPVWD